MTTENPLVSIITPTYNHERYVKACIESVLAQSYTNWEQIILDDASTDNTPEIIERYAKKDHRIKFRRHEQNFGITRLGDIYNEALDISKGKFVAILEGDDCWPSDKVEKQLELFSDPKVVLTWGAGQIINGDGMVLGPLPRAWRKWPHEVICNQPRGNAVKLLILGNFLMPSSTLVFRRQALLEIGGFWQPESCLCVDYPTCLKMSLQGEFSYSPQVLGYWRHHSNQVMGGLMHTSSVVVGEAFLNELLEIEKRQLGIQKMERSRLTAWASWLRGRRLMALGRRKRARHFFGKALWANQGIVSVKAGVAFVMSFLFPTLLQDKFASPLTVFIWLKKFLQNNSLAVRDKRPRRSDKPTVVFTQGASQEEMSERARKVAQR